MPASPVDDGADATGNHEQSKASCAVGILSPIRPARRPTDVIGEAAQTGTLSTQKDSHLPTLACFQMETSSSTPRTMGEQTAAQTKALRWNDMAAILHDVFQPSRA
jgi:hypothetical protein